MAIQMGACILPALMAEASARLGCQGHGPRSAVRRGLRYRRRSALEGPWLSRQRFGLTSSPRKPRLSIFPSQCFEGNFQYVLTRRIDRGARRPIAARTERHLCINQLPYGSKGARPVSSANASRDLCNRKTLAEGNVALQQLQSPAHPRPA